MREKTNIDVWSTFSSNIPAFKSAAAAEGFNIVVVKQHSPDANVQYATLLCYSEGPGGQQIPPSQEVKMRIEEEVKRQTENC